MAGLLARAILLDLDGTLIDSLGLIERSFRHMLVAHGREAAAPDFWKRGIGRPLDVQLSELARDEAELRSMVASYRSYNKEHHDSLVRPYAGVAEALERLRSRGARLAVVTSKARPGAEHSLAHTGLAAFIEVLVAAGDCARPKPDPEPVLRALAGLDAEPHEAVMVGDALPDLLAGRSAGVATAAVLWGACERVVLEAARPDRWLSSPEELGSL